MKGKKGGRKGEREGESEERKRERYKVHLEHAEPTSYLH